MKRQRIDLSELAAYDNLCLAVWKAARGKRQRPDVTRFLADLDRNLERLGEDLLRGAAPYGRYRSFTIHDPKRRLIHAICFEDRVLHHAILNLAEAVFERSLVPTTYACRPGKGVHRAAARVQRNLQRFPWFVQVDIDAYFPSIDHGILFDLVQRRFKGHGFLELLRHIIDSYHTAPGRGLPIGSLTSQHFANHYLDGADRFLLGHAAVRAHVRYMDDILWWCEDQTDARRVLTELRDYLANSRLLRLKPAVQINRSARGVTYCGFRILPGTMRLTARKRRRYRQLGEHWEAVWATGAISGLELQRAYDAVHAITLHTASLGWRKAHWQRHPSRYTELG